MNPEFILVLDFEATCGPSISKEQMEIIEFPIVVIDVRSKTVVDTFQTYVRPTLHPILDEFCTKLTGITQEQVQNAPVLSEVLPKAVEFSRKYFPKAVFVTCGDWDLKTMLRVQTQREELVVDHIFKNWTNVKKAFGVKYDKKSSNSMAAMLDFLKLKLEGRHHSGIDDSKNIAKIVIRLIEDGYVFK